jgi:hypothetical protein
MPGRLQRGLGVVVDRRLAVGREEGTGRAPMLAACLMVLRLLWGCRYVHAK